MEELISDFELNIHKAIDEILPEVDVLGCFFHLAKAFKKKVDKKEMKRHYENNPEFQKFIKQAIGLSSLPLGDLEEGLQWLEDNVHFENEKEEAFKIESTGLMVVFLHLSGLPGNEQETGQTTNRRDTTVK